MKRWLMVPATALLLGAGGCGIDDERDAPMEDAAEEAGRSSAPDVTGATSPPPVPPPPETDSSEVILEQ